MPTVRPHRPSRSGTTAGSRWSIARVGRAVGDDSGFTMVEMIVALVIIGIVMTALASFFVSTVSATSRQGTSQAAVQLADDAVERVRAMKETDIVDNRDQASSTTQWNSPVTGVAPYLTDMTMAYDSTATAGMGATATLPTVGSPVIVNGLTYNQNWYVGTCWQPLGGGSCGTTGPTGSTLPSNTYASFYRVVVAVTWHDTVCTSNNCVFIATTLVSNAAYDPQFDSNLVAQPPKVVNPGNQTSDKTVPDTLQLTSTGGAGAIIWSMSGLPTGLTFTSAGAISGTPSALGTFSVTVSATDSFGLIGTGAFTWTVVAPPVVTAAAQTDEVGAAASYTATCSCPGAVTWTATGLPPGLSINSSSGLMSGTPTTANVTGSSVTVTATDLQGGASSAPFTWVIDPALQTATPANQSNAVNTAITGLQLTATGGIGSHTWSASGLPTGLSLNSSTGLITGTPTVGNASGFAVTVTARDTTGVTSSASFTWVVTFSSLQITTPANQVSDVGTAVTAVSATKSGGYGSYTWSASGLPAGLSISSSTGQITGTPTTAGQSAVTISVRDSEPVTVTTATFIWTVVTAPTIVSPTNTLSSAKSTNLTGSTAVTSLVSGGVGPYTWSATGLPAGLSINASTGTITGTPTTATSYSVTLTVTDAKGVTDTQAITWTIVTTSATVMNIQYPMSNQYSIKGTAIATLTPSYLGGPSTGTLTWSVTSGLPAGLAINSSTGAITGTPTASTTTVYTMVLKVARGSVSDTQTITWTVYPNVANISSPTSGTQTAHGTAITPVGAQASGGSGTFTWTATGLPPGITISTWGVLSGTPTTAGTYSTVLTATDPLTGATDTQSFSWKIT